VLEHAHRQMATAMNNTKRDTVLTSTCIIQ